MVTQFNIVLGAITILQGLFLLFALAFNGGVGEIFVTCSFLSSATIMIILGCVLLSNGAKRNLTISLSLASIVLYLPMIWQRFQFKFIDAQSISSIDVWVVSILVLSLIRK